MQLAADRSAAAAWQTLGQLKNNPQHVFLDDGFSYDLVSPNRLTGHKQVTDAWLAQLARRHHARLVTLDTGLAITHPDVVLLIP